MKRQMPRSGSASSVCHSERSRAIQFTNGTAKSRNLLFGWSCLYRWALQFEASGKILLATLREIFDESAYARFLERAKMQSSRDAYAAFCREREAMKSRAHRCC